MEQIQKDFDELEPKDRVQMYIQLLRFVVPTRVASTKKSGDFTVIITIGVNKEGHWFIVKCDVGRFTPTIVIDKLFEHVTKFRPLEVRGEKAALQQVLNDFIDKKNDRHRNIF